ncbi:MAG: hypothetical protein ABIY55_31085 [Kofleriaceae bacterium]
MHELGRGAIAGVLVHELAAAHDRRRVGDELVNESRSTNLAQEYEG